jgi:alpha-glucoside transport system substrate-binding protein
MVGCGRRADAVDRPVVSVFGALSDADADAFMESVRGFERETGIDVRYVGSSNFESDLLERLRRGDAPDIALVPQPGLLTAIVEEGFATPWTGDLAEAAASMDERLVELASVDGQLFGAWYDLTLKSLVWYSPREFSARGLEVPDTWDELTEVAADIAASGTPPWCVGIRDGGATGWVATDWVEDLLLRFSGPDVYDSWVAHEVDFTDPAVQEAATLFGAIALDGDSVYGGNRAAVEFSTVESARQLVTAPASCLLHRQASFLPRMIGSEVTVAPDGDVWAFPLPAKDASSSAPLVVGGNLIVKFSDDAHVNAVAGHLVSDDAARSRVAAGGFVSPLESIALDDYRLPLDRAVAEWLRDADVLRFDASDLMPPEVGAGTFWSGMTAYLGGARLISVLQSIDDSWPVLTAVPIAIPASGSSG